jgi:ssRNA-specific RNase YbeY (16S rRNA maturation enzyme)
MSNKALGCEELYAKISSEQFTFTSEKGEEISKKLRSNNFPTPVISYKSKNPWSASLAYTTPAEKVIYLNLRNINRSQESIAETVIHEWTHLKGYSHGDNYPKGKEDSVPYKVARLARELCLQ